MKGKRWLEFLGYAEICVYLCATITTIGSSLFAGDVKMILCSVALAAMAFPEAKRGYKRVMD